MGKNRFNKFNQQQPEGEQQMAQPEEHSAEQQAEQAGAELVELLTGLPDLQEIVKESLEGEQQQAEPEAHSTEPVMQEMVEQLHEQLREYGSEFQVEPVKPEGETETLPVAPVLVLGIGQFVRQMMLKSTKTNAEILELVHKHFPEAKTTPACIAWYKSDLRKKGLISGSAVRGARSIVEFTPEMLADLCK